MSEVEVDEVLRLCLTVSFCTVHPTPGILLTMSDKAAKVPSHDTVPGGALPRVELDGC